MLIIIILLNSRLLYIWFLEQAKIRRPELDVEWLLVQAHYHYFIEFLDPIYQTY